VGTVPGALGTHSPPEASFEETLNGAYFIPRKEDGAQLKQKNVAFPTFRAFRARKLAVRPPAVPRAAMARVLP
jgi:hypothetical protein